MAVCAADRAAGTGRGLVAGGRRRTGRRSGRGRRGGGGDPARGLLGADEAAQVALRRRQFGLEGLLLLGDGGRLLAGRDLGGLGHLELGGGVGLQLVGLGDGGARDDVGTGGRRLDDGHLVEDVGAVGAGRLEQGGPLDQLGRVGGGEQRGGLGEGAALHVAVAGEVDDLLAGHGQRGGGLGGLGRGDVGPLARGLVGGLGGLVVVERDRRGGVRGVDGGLRGGERAVDLLDAGGQRVGGGLGLGDAPGGGSGRTGGDTHRESDGEHARHEGARDRAPGTAVHDPTSKQEAPGRAPLLVRSVVAAGPLRPRSPFRVNGRAGHGVRWSAGLDANSCRPAHTVWYVHPQIRLGTPGRPPAPPGSLASWRGTCERSWATGWVTAANCSDTSAPDLGTSVSTGKLVAATSRRLRSPSRRIERGGSASPPPRDEGTAVASHVTALALWELIEHPAGPVHVTVDLTKSARGSKGVTVHRSPRIDAETTTRRRLLGHLRRAVARRPWGQPAPLRRSDIRAARSPPSGGGRSRCASRRSSWHDDLGSPVAPTGRAHRAAGHRLPERTGDLGLPERLARARDAAVRPATTHRRRRRGLPRWTPPTTRSSSPWSRRRRLAQLPPAARTRHPSRRATGHRRLADAALRVPSSHDRTRGMPPRHPIRLRARRALFRARGLVSRFDAGILPTSAHRPAAS